MFSRKVEQKIFNEEQVFLIKDYINQKLLNLEFVKFSEKEMMKKPKYSDIVIIEEALGRARYQIPLHELPESILDTLNKIAIKYNKNLKLDSATFARYSNKYGNPKLPPHMDKHDANFTIFYQIFSNIDWPIFVQQESETLKDNEGFLLNTKNTIHWRYPRIFKDGDQTDMIFFHFQDGTTSMLSVQDRYDICEPWKKIYNRIINEQYGYDIN